MYLLAVLFVLGAFTQVAELAVHRAAGESWWLDAGAAAMCMIAAGTNVRSARKERARRERVADALNVLNRFRKW